MTNPNPHPVPLVDLGAQHRELKAELMEAISEIVDRGDFILGADVAGFERELAMQMRVAHAVGVGNGTDAIEMALRALDLDANDEVILPANTFIATAEAVVRAGLRPVIVDCDPEHLLIDPLRVAEAKTDRTGAVIAVHLFGQAAPVEWVQTAAGPLVPVVEDAAQSQGATRHGRPTMGLGTIAATSFYPGKNLGAWGDAGAVLTSNDELARRVRAMRDHGSEVKYHHPELGMNSRLDTIQAVVLRAKLRHLAGWNAERRVAAARYGELLANVDGVQLPATMVGNDHIWHLYVVRVAKRDRVLEQLREAGIGAGIHYPVPVHLQGAFADLGYGPGSFPVAEAAAAEILTLPLYPGITEVQQERVAEALRFAVAGRRAA